MTESINRFETSSIRSDDGKPECRRGGVQMAGCQGWEPCKITQGGHPLPKQLGRPVAQRVSDLPEAML